MIFHIGVDAMTCFHEGMLNESKDMKSIGDNHGIGEVLFNKVSISRTKVNTSDFNAFSAR